MKTNITIICDNNIYNGAGFIAEHGLSILIESGDGTSLYDTGQGQGIINNLKVLEKNIQGIDRIIISHGHFDHVTGLMSILERHNNEMPVYLNPDSLIEKYAYSEIQGIPNIYSIGWPHTQKEYESKGAVFKPVKGMTKITDNIYSFSNIKHEPGWKSWDTRLKRKENDTIADDPFTDDLSLLLDTKSGPVVLLGCAHAGIIDILNEMSRETGYKKFHAVIGGTHLGSAPEDYIKQTVSTLENFKVEVIGTSHCTGFRVASALAVIFKDKFINASVGTVFEF